MFKKTNHEKKQVVTDIEDTLNICDKSEGFCVFFSYYFTENGEKKMNHKKFLVNFNLEDLSVVMDTYIEISNKDLSNKNLKKIRRIKPLITVSDT